MSRPRCPPPRPPPPPLTRLQHNGSIRDSSSARMRYLRRPSRCLYLRFPHRLHTQSVKLGMLIIYTARRGNQQAAGHLGRRDLQQLSGRHRPFPSASPAPLESRLHRLRTRLSREGGKSEQHIWGGSPDAEVSRFFFSAASAFVVRLCFAAFDFFGGIGPT